MAEPILNPPRVVASIGQGITAGMSQHVSMDRKGEANGPPRSVAKMKAESGDCRRSTRSARTSSPRIAGPPPPTDRVGDVVLIGHPADGAWLRSINCYLVEVENFDAVQGEEVQDRSAAPARLAAVAAQRHAAGFASAAREGSSSGSSSSPTCRSTPWPSATRTYANRLRTAAAA
jgi:hypothetical protein